MSKNNAHEAAPTMIIPSGTQIEVDAHGQLSIHTPGNLVIQNSGNYGTIESKGGSIRIEPDVQVEAVNVKCSKACYVQGSLTAWKVQAESIELEESARAHIILQETDRLHIGKEARIVGNFTSEKELFLLFSRFAQQMRSLPFGWRAEGKAPAEGGQLVEEMATPALQAVPHLQEPDYEIDEPVAQMPIEREPTPDELSDALFYAQVLLERESEKLGGGPTYRSIVSELLRMIKEREIDSLGDRFEGLFSEISHPSDDLSRVRQLLVEHYESSPA